MAKPPLDPVTFRHPKKAPNQLLQDSEIAARMSARDYLKKHANYVKRFNDWVYDDIYPVTLKPRVKHQSTDVLCFSEELSKGNSVREWLENVGKTANLGTPDDPNFPKDLPYGTRHLLGSFAQTYREQNAQNQLVESRQPPAFKKNFYLWELECKKLPDDQEVRVIPVDVTHIDGHLLSVLEPGEETRCFFRTVEPKVIELAEIMPAFEGFPEEGQLILAPYEGVYYRAACVGCDPDKRSVFVHFIDYGNMQQVDLKLIKEFCHSLMFRMICRMVGLDNIDDQDVKMLKKKAAQKKKIKIRVVKEQIDHVLANLVK